MPPLTGFAVDLGGTKIAAARFAAGRIVDRATCPTRGCDPASGHLAAMGALLDRLGHVRGAPLGVAVAGRIDRDGAWHAVNTDTLRAVQAVPLAARIGADLGPARCLNDAAAAALAEARLGAGRGVANFAYLTVSTGVGGGLVLNGRLVDSGTGLAGHVGFVTSPGGTEPCGSGRRGTVESQASGRAMAAAARRLGQGGDARAICAAAEAGQPWAETIVARSARAVAVLIADLTAILGLEAVALGGGIGLSEGYARRVQAALDTEPALFRPRLHRAACGAEAPLFGALLHALDEGGTPCG